MFFLVKKKVFRGPPPEGRKDEERLRKALQDLSRDESRDLIRNFRERCEEVVEREGGRLDY